MESSASSEKSADQSRASVAEHIALETSRLARLAKANDFSLLAYLIEMAVLEAWREAEEGGPVPAGRGDSAAPCDRN